MTITLTNGGTTLSLPPDLIWADELTWSAVAQSTERGIFGTLIVDAMARNGGRPITLQGDGDSAWIDRGTLRTLGAWAQTPGLRMALDVRGEIFSVIFDHGPEEETRAIAMSAVIDYSDKQDGDYYCSLVLRFIEASETL
jgi:hypothetical protein